MEYLPVEIINEILLRADTSSLYHTVQVSILWRQLSLKQVKLINTIEDFCDCCYHGDRLSIVRSAFTKQWLGKGLYNACRGGHKELVELIISKGATCWDGALVNACLGGHKELVELMIAQGGNYWEGGVLYASYGGHKELVELMFEKCNEQWNFELEKAIQGGHEHSVDEIMDIITSCYNEAACQAAEAGHKTLAQFIISKALEDHK